MFQPRLSYSFPVSGLKAATGYSKAELWIIDLADFESVKQFADKFERDGGRLDILVENAALATFDYDATKDGWEASLVLPFHHCVRANIAY
jgi:NAD(P)-dependent dehydrogenase (short-subunit alcohol dehydrogenase family)